MTNPLCTARECKTPFGCSHRGPQGQMCHFEAEKKLAEFLDLEWRQDMTLDDLLTHVRVRLTGVVKTTHRLEEIEVPSEPEQNAR